MPHTEPTAEEVLPIREIDDRYPGEWVLIKILDSSGPLGDAPGVMLAHGPSRKKMSRELQKTWKREPDALLTPGRGSWGPAPGLQRQQLRSPR